MAKSLGEPEDLSSSWYLKYAGPPSLKDQRMTRTMEETFELDHNGIRKLRIPEETAKYLRERKELQARFWRLPETVPKRKLNAGDNHNRVRGQALGFKKLNVLGTYLGIQPDPNPAEFRNPLYQALEEKHKAKMKEKYGNAATEDLPPSELLLMQREREVEHDRADVIAPTEEKQLATCGTVIPSDLLLVQAKLAEELKKVTAEDVEEAYRMNKVDLVDPMKDFLN